MILHSTPASVAQGSAIETTLGLLIIRKYVTIKIIYSSYSLHKIMNKCKTFGKCVSIDD